MTTKTVNNKIDELREEHDFRSLEGSFRGKHPPRLTSNP